MFLEKIIIARVATENNTLSEKRLLVIFTNFGISVCPCQYVFTGLQWLSCFNLLLVCKQFCDVMIQTISFCEANTVIFD